MVQFRAVLQSLKRFKAQAIKNLNIGTEQPELRFLSLNSKIPPPHVPKSNSKTSTKTGPRRIFIHYTYSSTPIEK